MSRDLAQIYFRDYVDEVISSYLMEAEELIELLERAENNNKVRLDVSMAVALAKRDLLKEIDRAINEDDNYKIPVGIAIEDKDPYNPHSCYWTEKEHEEYWKNIIEDFGLRRLIEK